MFSQIFYLVRSNKDGKYLTAHPNQDSGDSYLLIFREHFDALSYLNKYATDVIDRFGVESLAGSQLSGLLKRWGFNGVALVQDPLLPRIEFLLIE